jgi:hypothetical protein
MRAAAVTAARPTRARPRGALPPPRLLLLAVVLGACAFHAAAQQAQPLQGYGEAQPPGNGTTAVWVSAYLDRLLEVSESSYEFHVSYIMHAYLCIT